MAYLLGSIPTSVWYGLAYFGVDVRTQGSGNAGATNTFRVLGKKAGTVVIIIDILKGWTAANLVLIPVALKYVPIEQYVTFQLIYGFLAVLGHVFPVFEGFRGGKGVATLMGMVIALHVAASLLCLGVFLAILLTFKYVSLGSMLGALVFPVSILLGFFGKDQSPLQQHEHLQLIIFGFCMFVLVIVSHRKNVVRLLKGQEGRMYLFGKPKH